jgi:excisionase family DNA binding protein
VSTTELLTIADVAERLHLSRGSVYSLIRANRLAAKKIGRKTVVLASELDRFIENAPAAEMGGDRHSTKAVWS